MEWNLFYLQNLEKWNLIISHYRSLAVSHFILFVSFISICYKYSTLKLLMIKFCVWFLLMSWNLKKIFSNYFVYNTFASNMFYVIGGIILKFPIVFVFLVYDLKLFLPLQKHLTPSIIRSWNWQFPNVSIIYYSRTNHSSFEKLRNWFKLLSDENLKKLSDDAENVNTKNINN